MKSTYKQFTMRALTLFFLIFLSFHSHSLNFKKLQLREITLVNNLNHEITVHIELHTKCTRCKDQFFTTEVVNFKGYETKECTYSNFQTITHITTVDPTLSFFIERFEKQTPHSRGPKLKHVIQFTNKAKLTDSLNFTEFDFNTTMNLVYANSLYSEYLHNRIPQHLTYLLPQGISPSKLLTQIKELHDKNSLSKVAPSDAPKIPLIIHQIWFGITGDMSRRHKKWQKDLKKLHTGWRTLCWNTQMITTQFSEGFYNQDIFDEAAQRNAYASMADIARYEIITKFGGFYTDTDSEPFESLIPLHLRYDFFTSLEPVSKYPLGCALNAFGAKPNHPIMQANLNLCKQRKNISPEIYKKIEHLARIFPMFSPPVIKTFYNTGPYLFIAGVLEGMDQQNNTDIIFPNNYCCHWFAPTLESFCRHHPHVDSKKNQSQHWKSTITKKK